MGTSALRIGIVGCGNVLEAYMPLCAKLKERGLAEVVAACGRPSQKERTLSLGVPTFTTDEHEVIDSAGLDVIVILASMPEHGRLARMAILTGKHVLVEKPLAGNLQDAAELIAIANQREVRLVCAPFTTLSPTFQMVAHRLRQGDIGTPCSARGRYGWAGPWWNDWFYKPGGGCLLDLGIYSLTTLTGLLGPAKRVTALAGVAIPERIIDGRKIAVEAEDNAQVLIDFGGATFGVVTTGFTIQQYRSPAVEIYGTLGTLQILGDDWDPDGYELWQNSAGCWQVFKESNPDWPWTDGLRDLVESLHSGKPPRTCPDHAYHVLEIILKAKQSSKEGRTLSIESSFRLPNMEEPPAVLESAHLAHDRTREHR